MNKGVELLMNKSFTVDEDNTVLLIIDIQDRLVVVMDDREEVVDNTQKLIESSELLEIPMIITEQYRKGLGSTIKEITDNREFYANIQKTTFSAYNDQLKTALKELGKKNIIVAGMETHVCVLQTVRDLVADGYQVHLASDAVTSRTEANYQNGLDLMQNMGAVVSNTETILFDLLKDSNRPEFKPISKLIK